MNGALKLAAARRDDAAAISALTLCPCGGFCEDGTLSRASGDTITRKRSYVSHCVRCGAQLPKTRRRPGGALCVWCEKEIVH